VPDRARSIANIQPPPSPAQRGNDRAASHGAFRPAVIGKRAAELAPEILEANAHLDAVRDRPAVMRYAVLLARIERVYRWLAEQADDVFSDTDDGEAHRIFERLEKWESGADRAEDRLAIAPLTRARLGLTIARAADLSTAMSEPDPERRRELMIEAGVPDDDEAER